MSSPPKVQGTSVQALQFRLTDDEDLGVSKNRPTPPSSPTPQVRTSTASAPPRNWTPSSIDEPATERERLLAAYQASLTRPLRLDRAVAAFKLRAAAQVYCAKSDTNRFLPRTATEMSKQRLEALTGTDVDELIADLEKNPSKYDRTQLNEVALRHFIAALNIDEQALWKGVKQSAPYEGLHSMAGRISTLATTLASAGVVGAIPGSKELVDAGSREAAKVGKKAVNFIAHQGPSAGWNPYLTGKLRMVTNVKQNRLLTGGQPKLARNIEGDSADMGTLAGRMARQRALLQAANRQYSKALESGEGQPQALQAMVDAYLALHRTANDDYKARIGANRSQTYSKGYGAGVNAVAAAGSLITVTVPGAGQVAGPVIQGVCIPLQAGAGYLDEFTKHRYNLRANMKWGDFLTDEGKRVHFKDLQQRHVAEAGLRQAHNPEEQQRIADIRQVYEYELSKLHGKREQLEQRIDKLTRGTPPGQPESAKVQGCRADLAEVKKDIEAGQAHATLFESFSQEAWAAIPPDSAIGKCLDSPAALEKLHRRARDNLLGEAERQIMQRYLQAAHAGISSGVALPVSDAIGMVDGLHVNSDGSGGLEPAPAAASLGVGIVGAKTFVATTGEVRMTKADNGPRLKAKVDAQDSRRRDRIEQDKKDWTFEAGDRKVDLRNSSVYDKLYHTRAQRLARTASAFSKSVISGPKGVLALAAAKKQRSDARKTMQETLGLLAASGAVAAGLPRAANFAGMKDALYDHPDVAAYLRPHKDKGKQAAEAATTEPTKVESPPQPIDLDKELEAIEAKRKAEMNAKQEKQPAGGTLSEDLSDEELAAILALWS